MKWFTVARIGVLVTLVTGIYMHLSRLVFGIDLTLQHLVTNRFDSAFAVVLILATLAVFMARHAVFIGNGLDKFLFYFTLVYFAVSVPIHVRSWFVPENTQMLRIFPAWYSVFFLMMTGLMLLGWSKLREKPAATMPMTSVGA